ncbi:hypothetical protein FORC69_p149 (plasmid) [Escherichia coli]|nr:hypothetical protein FORC69_p149 [Escherichia coli]
MSGMTEMPLRQNLRRSGSPKRTAGLSETPLAGTESATAVRQLPPIPCKKSDYPEARRRRTSVGHPDGGGSLYPAGDDAGVAGTVGCDVQRQQLRVPARTLGASGSEAGSEIHRVGLQLGVDLDLEKFFDR